MLRRRVHECKSKEAVTKSKEDQRHWQRHLRRLTKNRQIWSELPEGLRGQQLKHC